MKKNHLLLIIVVIITMGIGFWFINTSEPESTQLPDQPIAISQPSGNFKCKDMYNEIEDDLERANYCETDADCSVIMLGGRYIDFGCHHFINKDVDQDQFFIKMNAYENQCSKIINKCAPAPDVTCVSHKCVFAG